MSKGLPNHNRAISLGDIHNGKTIGITQKVINDFTILKFGKYKGQRAGDVKNPGYFKWLNDQKGIYRVDPSLLK